MKIHLPHRFHRPGNRPYAPYLRARMNNGCQQCGALWWAHVDRGLQAHARFAVAMTQALVAFYRAGGGR